MTKDELINKAKYSPHWYSEKQLSDLMESISYKDEGEKKISFALYGAETDEEYYDNVAETLLIQEIGEKEYDRRVASGYLEE